MSVSVRPTRHEVLLGNRPILDEAPTRAHQDMVPAGTQGRLVRAGEAVHQLLTEDVVTLTDWSLKHTPLQHPTTSAIYFDAAGTPDGAVVYVNQAKDRLLKAKDGEVEVLAEQPGITSAVTPTEDGGFLFGTGDGKIHAVHADGTREEHLQMPWRVAPERVAAGQDGTTFVSVHRGLAAFDPAGQKLWGKQVPTTRGGHTYPLLLTQDGQRLIHTGLDHAAVAFDAKTGDEVWTVKLDPKEGDCFNEGTLDRDGNLYTVSGQGVLFKISPEGKVLWKRDGGGPGPSSVVTNARVEIDTDGNVCVNPNTERFQVFTAEGVPLLDLKGKERMEGASYLFDFTLSPDGHKALLLTRRMEENGYRLLEVGLPGPAAPLLAGLPEAPAEPTATIQAGPREVTIGDIQLPVRL